MLSNQSLFNDLLFSALPFSILYFIKTILIFVGFIFLYRAESKFENYKLLWALIIFFVPLGFLLFYILEISDWLKKEEDVAEV